MERLYYYLNRGLWSFSCHFQHEKNTEQKKEEEKLLWCIASDPTKFGFCSELVDTPWDVSWLAASTIQSRKKAGCDGNLVSLHEVEAVKKEAEFQQLLTSLPNASTSAAILEELMHLYGQVVRAEHISSPVNHITATARQFLKHCLLKDPVTTNEVIQLLLCVWSPYFEEPDEDLQNIYLEVLEAGVETLEHIGGQNADLEQYQSALLCIVSQFEVSEQRMEAVRYLLIRLCEAGVLPRDMLYLALVSRAKPKLLTSLGTLEDEKYERTCVLFDSENIQRISGRLLNVNGTLNAEELFLRAVKTKKHWIEDLLELCGQLLIDNHSETVVRYFSCGMMNKLWPLLLLHIWKHFSDHSDICEMLQFLLQYCKEAVMDPLLSMGCMMVEKQIMVALWCRKHALPLTCKELLDMTATHSLLEVLFRTTKLSELPLEEVRELLIKNVPDFQGSDVAESEDCSSISWEVSTFDGFCVLRKALSIIQASIEINKLSKILNRPKSDVLKVQSIPMYFTHNWLSVILQCSVREDKVTDSLNLESWYKENVTQQLEELKKMLSRLFPLKFRIDILEDIFSLLFLRYEDLTEESSSESGEEDYVEHDTRNCASVNITSLLMRRMSHESSDCNTSLAKDISLQTIPVIEAQISGLSQVPASPPKILATSSPAAMRHAPGRIKETQTSSSLPTSFTTKSAEVTFGNIRRESKKSLSGKNVSEMAATLKGQNHGFLLDKSLVRDLLYMLKESLVDISAAHYSLLASQQPVLGRQDDVLLRIKLLLQHVSEAAWKLQLITGTEFMQHSGYDPQVVDSNVDNGSDWLYQSEESASEDEQETNIRMRKTSLRKCKSETERSSESGSQSANTETQKLRRKSHIGKAPLPVINKGIINLMLAPHSSMVIRCLMHGELNKANQIIQMLDMKGENQLPKEVRFMESYCSLKARLNEALKETKSPYQPKVLSLSAPEIDTKVTTLQDIKKVASAGMHSTSLTSMVQSFLSVTEIPEIRGSREVGKEFTHESTLLQESENSAVMVCLDLALTVGSTSEHSASLLDVAYKHSTALQSMGTPDSCSKTKPVGYIQFARTAVYVLKEAKRTETSLLPKNTCLRGIVNSENLPFSMKGIRDYISFWNALNVATMELQQELNSVTPRKYSNLTEFYSIKPHEIFRRIISLCKGWQLNTHGSKRHLNYLQQIHEYLKHVSYLALYNWQENSGAISDLVKPNSLFDLLKEDLTSLIGKLVFEQDVSPTQVEPVTSKLKLNIVHNIVCNCCPKIPTFYTFQEGAKDINKKWGKVILNDAQYTGTSRHPEEAVRSLLSEVLQTIQDELGEGKTYSLQLKQGINLLPSGQLQHVLAKTNELSAVDITWLSIGDETLTFFVNLTNLLWIHSLIVLETGTKPFGLLSPSPFQRQVAQKSVGYIVGQLGFISLLQLQKNLLGDLAFSPATSVLKHFASVENLKCEKWKESVGSTIDPRVLFVLTNGQLYSPKVQVMHVENLDKQLDTSLSDYLNNNVRLEGGSDTAQHLVVPELLLVYQDLVLLNQEPESHSTLPGLPAAQSPHHFSLMANTEQVYSRERLYQLLDFLRENINQSTLQAQIADFTSSDSELLVKVERNSGKFGITLCYAGTKEPMEKAIEDEVEDIWKQRVVHEGVLKFLDHHCWLLSLLVQQIHKEKSLHASPVTEGRLTHQALDERVQVLMHVFQSDWVATLTPIFDDNAAVAGLHTYPSASKLWNFLEYVARKRDWQHCVEVLWTLPEKELQENCKLQALNDIAMFELASKLPAEGDPSPWWYCQHIGDVLVQVHCILQQLPQWPGSACTEALQAVLGDTDKQLSAPDKLELENMLHNISIYSKVLEVVNSPDIKTWYDVCCTSQNNPRLILDYLIQAKDPQLCLQWAELQKIPIEAKYLIDYKFIQLLLESETVNFSVTQELLESLPPPQVVQICDKLICVVRSLPCLKFLTDLLLNSYEAHLSVEQYKNLSIGIKMVSSLPVEEQSQLWELIGQPMWLIEQYLMNTRLEMLERMLLEVQPLLSELPSASPLSVNNIDKLLRQYAAKALDFRVARAPFRTFPSQEKLMASLSVASNHSEEFVMPAVVPTKNEWVPNDQVSACMCCEAVSFSMFNRRHHCRRCGRVICWSCSKNRMKVAGYGEMPVRVCNDCHLLSNGDADLPSASTDESKPPFSLDMGGTDFTWRLSSDEMYNAMVREEFAYDYAPSVSLCLSILKLHSEHVAHPRFLLDACDRMLQLLQPIDGSVNPEVDYSLVIRMVRSLVVAAKVKHAQAGYNTGVAHCDELLSQVDLLNLLVKSGCSSLLPAEPLSGHALRRLRDRLVSEELWALAMDVSTKSGLDKAGVWAAWGKACLRAGCWSAAREKFSHCLDASTRPARNPPLLVEILQILEEGAYAVDHKILQHADKLPTSSEALAVVHTLSSLKDIAQGNYLSLSTNTVIIGPKMDSLFYSESCYYIETYGSHMGILGFYLKHDDIPAALKHALTNRIDPDIFLEAIYIPCLQHGIITDLHSHLSVMDSTLHKWKVYLCHVCHKLEKQGLLNVLYQLQLFMQDYIRAAMTCIRFYRVEARCYSDLATNLEHLYIAQKHLETELSFHSWQFPNQSSQAHSERNKAGLAMKLEPREINRHISTILRQIEVTRFLEYCEKENRQVLRLQRHLQVDSGSRPLIPTLFDTNTERMHLAALIILCGRDVEEGFGLAYRIMEDYQLRTASVCNMVGRVMARHNRIADIAQLVRCIQSSGISDCTSLCDSMLILCIQTFVESDNTADVEPVIKLISDCGTKILAYIKCQQLKSAYLLAVKHNRLEDVQKILEAARKSGQTKIEQICLKRLAQQHSAT